MDGGVINSFEPFPKIPRFNKAGGICITEKIDGTNAQIFITGSPPDDKWTAKHDDLYIYCGSRTRLVTPDEDNFGFAGWVAENVGEIIKLGHGRHYGEWWGCGIQRNYWCKDKRFSLFNVERWEKIPEEHRPNCVSIVPVLYRGAFDTAAINETLEKLKETGSQAAPGFMAPEGIVIYHYASNCLFKKTFNDNHKGEENNG